MSTSHDTAAQPRAPGSCVPAHLGLGGPRAQEVAEAKGLLAAEELQRVSAELAAMHAAV